jgi:hypothetical protein
MTAECLGQGCISENNLPVKFLSYLLSAKSRETQLKFCSDSHPSKCSLTGGVAR